jgi:hypothetical protein
LLAVEHLQSRARKRAAYAFVILSNSNDTARYFTVAASLGIAAIFMFFVNGPGQI